MSTPVESTPDASAARQTAIHIGFPVAIALACFAVLGFVLGIATPPRSGPHCKAGCIAYPYADAVAFFPRDYWWMLPGVMLAPLFAVVCVCIHFCAPSRMKPLSLLAAGFSLLSSGIIAVDYGIQVLALQPALRRGEMDGVALLTQYNPHGLFIVLEDVGYLLLAFAFLFAGTAVPSETRPGKMLRWVLVGAFVLSSVTLVAFAVLFGVEMALPFELAIIAVVWIALAVAGILAAILFRRLGMAGTPRARESVIGAGG